MTDNSWYESAVFPELGEKCEGLILADTINQKWSEGMCEGAIYSPNGGAGVVFSVGSILHFIGAVSHLRPLKSDRDKAIEAAVEAVSNAKLGFMDGNAAFFGALYDAGLLRLPD